MKPKTNHDIAVSILALIQAEAGARKDCESLIALGGLSDCDKAIVRNMQQDQTDHIVALLAMVARYDGGIAASPEVAAALMEVSGEAESGG